MLLLFTVLSCGDTEVDITPPMVESMTFNPEPEAAEICGSIEPEVFLLTGGEQLTFDALFTDNEALSQIKVDIHHNFDCHGHGGGAAPSLVVPNVNNQTEDWTVLTIDDITGTSWNAEQILNVPENVTAGNYHFHIQVIDEAGNDSPFSNFLSLKIKNPLDSTAPGIAVDLPAGKSFSAAKGESVQFAGQVTDDRSLSEGGNGVLYLAYTDLSSGNTFTTDQAFAFDENVETTFDFDFEFTIPQTLTTGSYRFSLGANDGVRNVAPFQFFEVEITN